MLLWLYGLGFSYYYYALAARMELPHEPLLSIIVFSIQSLVWLKLFQNRSLLSPMHIFFSLVLGLLFTMDTLIIYEAAYSGFFKDYLFYPAYTESVFYQTQWKSIIEPLQRLDSVSFYSFAFPLLFLSSILLGDLYRFRREKDPNKSIGMCFFNPFFLLFVWNAQSPVLVLLPLFCLYFSSTHYLWKALFSGLILCLHPVGLFLNTAMLLEKGASKNTLGFLISFLPIIILFLSIKSGLQINGLDNELLHFSAAALFGLILGLVSIRNTKLNEGMASSIGVGFMCLALLAFDYSVYQNWSFLLLSLLIPIFALTGQWILVMGLVTANVLQSFIGKVPNPDYAFYLLFFVILILQAFKFQKEFRLNISIRQRSNIS